MKDREETNDAQESLSMKEGKAKYEKPQIVIEEYEMTSVCSLSGGVNGFGDGWDF